jgi:hypothetical protein
MSVTPLAGRLEAGALPSPRTFFHLSRTLFGTNL